LCLYRSSHPGIDVLFWDDVSIQIIRWSYWSLIDKQLDVYSGYQKTLSWAHNIQKTITVPYCCLIDRSLLTDSKGSRSTVYDRDMVPDVILSRHRLALSVCLFVCGRMVMLLWRAVCVCLIINKFKHVDSLAARNNIDLTTKRGFCICLLIDSARNSDQIPQISSNTREQDINKGQLRGII